MSKASWIGVLATVGLTSIATAKADLAPDQPLTPVPEPAPPPPPPPMTGPPPGQIYAQPVYVPRPPPPLIRQGFVIGFAIGGGYEFSSFSGANSYGAWSFEFHLGGMLSPQLAAQIDFGSQARWLGYDTRLSVNSTMFCLQFWPNPKVWLKGGGGFGYISQASYWDGYYISSGVGGMLGAALGFEIMQQRNFAVDIQARYSVDWFEGLTAQGIGFLIGVSWY